jgi:hypothetical protein
MFLIEAFVVGMLQSHLLKEPNDALFIEEIKL